MSIESAQPQVAIVLCTYNGEQHIREQLDSLVNQTWPIVVLVFDDASSDSTLTYLDAYKGKLDLRVTSNTNNLGYVANFESGIEQALSEGFDYIALCDQDDKWHPERIAKGMRLMLNKEKQQSAQSAVLAHSDLRMIDQNGDCIHPSFFQYRHYEINQARNLATVLGQNGVMGNTVLINRALAELSLPFPKQLHVHDYWLAVLAELHGIRLLVNDQMVDYRIHQANASNSDNSIKFGIRRALDKKSWRGFINRDYRLPFKEDERLNVVNTLLDPPAHIPAPDEQQKQLLIVFKSYLTFGASRWSILQSMMRAGFFRKGLAHKLRLSFSTLFTRRYER